MRKMRPETKEIEEFFREYEGMFNRGIADPPEIDVETQAGFYATEIIAANPHGVAGGKNDESFRAVIPQGYAFYRSIGTKEMKVKGIEITPIDGLHILAKVHWDSRYERISGEEVRIEFEVTYLLQKTGDRLKIFGYITGDEQDVLKEHGLL